MVACGSVGRSRLGEIVRSPHRWNTPNPSWCLVRASSWISVDVHSCMRMSVDNHTISIFFQTQGRNDSNEMPRLVVRYGTGFDRIHVRVDSSVEPEATWVRSQWKGTNPSVASTTTRRKRTSKACRWRRKMAPNQWLAERRQELTTGFEKWMNRQPDYVEVAAVTLGGAVQGGAIGGMMGMITKIDPDTPQKVANASNPTQAAALAGGPLAQARNFAVMTGVNAGLSLAIKKARGGVEDVQGNMMAAFGSGAAFTVVSGMGGGPNLAVSAVSTGVVFALLQGAFYKIGKSFAPQPDDGKYTKTRTLLTKMNLEKYEKNFRKGQLTDDTMFLLTDSALSEVRIPPGPRLLILDQTSRLKARSSSAQAAVSSSK